MTCLITGVLGFPDGSTYPNAYMYFERIGVGVVSQGGAVVIPEKTIVRSDGSANVSFSLLYGVYQGTIQTTLGDVKFKITVPDDPTADFGFIIGDFTMPILDANVQLVLDARDEAVDAAANAALYDGPKVDIYADLAALTPTQLAVGKYVRVIATGAVYQRVATGGDLDYTGTGGIRLAIVLDTSPLMALASATITDAQADLRTAYIDMLPTGLAAGSPANLRSGLSAAVYASGGYQVELAITVTGTKGSKVLTTAETAKVAAMGATTFEAALVPTSGLAFFATVLSNNGTTTITLRDALTADFSGVLSAKYDSALGQHLTQAGTRAFAAHVAAQVGVDCARGGMIEGCWHNRPSTYFAGVWAKNAALTSYGVSNSAAPIVQSSLLNAGSATNIQVGMDAQPVRPISLANRGIWIGTHAAGHGADAAVVLGRRSAVVEFWTGAFRDDTISRAGTQILVTLEADGVEIYRITTDHIARRHLITVEGADKAVIKISNLDGGIYYIETSQLTVREAGIGGRLFAPLRKIAVFGDSWFAFYDGLFGKVLSEITGSMVDAYALGGMTTEWALSWFDTYIARKNYDAVLFHFYTNDGNDLSAQTFVDPLGANIPRWPAGLTTDQSMAHWAKNLSKLVARTQLERAQPIIVKPCGTASVGQALKHTTWGWYIDAGRPVAMIPQPGELADVTAFVNRFGKYKGAVMVQGQGVVYASGPLAADAWSNPVADALVPLQQSVLKAVNYTATRGFTIGTDGDANGLSDGLTYINTGTIETVGETFTPSIVGGAQRFAANYVAPNSGQKRVAYPFSVISGKDYILMLEVKNGPANERMEFFSTIDGGATLSTAAQSTLSASGAFNCWMRETADITKTAYAYINTTRTNGATDTFDVSRAFCIDTAALYSAAPNARNMSDVEIVAFVMGMAL